MKTTRMIATGNQGHRNSMIEGVLLCLALIVFIADSWGAQQRGSREESDSGRQTFVSSCSACHGIDGRGGEHAPNIATNPAVQQFSDREISNILENGIPAGGMPSFKALGPAGIKSVVEYLRVLQGKQTILIVPGSPTHGRELFYGAARCSSCHTVDGYGGFLGPDLSEYARSHSPKEIREAIVDPNKDLPQALDTVIAVTRGGRKLVGIARNEDNFSLQLQTADGVFHLLTKADLALLRHEPKSMMPSDYGSHLTAGDLNDLVSFLVRVSGTRGGTTRGTKQATESY